MYGEPNLSGLICRIQKSRRGHCLTLFRASHLTALNDASTMMRSWRLIGYVVSTSRHSQGIQPFNIAHVRFLRSKSSVPKRPSYRTRAHHLDFTMKLKEIQRTATFAWGTSASSLPLIATGTVSGALDETFSNVGHLEIWAPEFFDADHQEGLELGGEGQSGPKGAISTNSR